MTAQSLPAINATLNGISTVFLIAGYILIRRGHWRNHGIAMACAFFASTLFLAGYVAHRVIVGEQKSGLQPGMLRTAYLVLLLTHVVLAIVVVPMVLLTLYRASRRQWDRHRRLARRTLPIWLYVSATGVLIYWLLYHVFPAIRAI